MRLRRLWRFRGRHRFQSGVRLQSLDWTVRWTPGATPVALQATSDGRAYVAVNVFTSDPFEGFGVTLENGFILVKLDRDRDVVWLHATPGNHAIAALEPTDDGVAFTGTFRDRVAFGPLELDAEGDVDVFVAQLTRSGEPLYAASFTSPDYDYSTALSAHPEGGLMVLLRLGKASDTLPSGTQLAWLRPPR